MEINKLVQQVTAPKDFTYNDGGRSLYFKGRDAGDCVARAMAIALQLDYKTCYDQLAAANVEAGGKKTARNGLLRKTYEKVLNEHGWIWHPAPKFKGRKARYYNLPKGRLIMRMAKHVSALVDGEIHDTWDCSKKMVYGYFVKPRKDVK